MNVTEWPPLGVLARTDPGRSDVKIGSGEAVAIPLPAERFVVLCPETALWQFRATSVTQLLDNLA